MFVVGVSHGNEALDRRIEIPAKGRAPLKPQIVGIDNDAQNIQTAGRSRLVVLPCVGSSDAVRVDVESSGAFERPSYRLTGFQSDWIRQRVRRFFIIGTAHRQFEILPSNLGMDFGDRGDGSPDVYYAKVSGNRAVPL
jgi:hypothetical protein